METRQFGQTETGADRLADKEAIRDLVLAYSRGVDRQDFAFLRTLYTEDGMEDDHGGLFNGPAAAYVDWLEGNLPRLALTCHTIHNHLITLDGDQAQGEVYTTNYHRMSNGKGGFDELIIGARYLDHYRKDGGRWRFARRTVVKDWVQRQPAYWDLEDDVLKKSPLGRAGKGDPSYQVLSDPRFGR